MKIPDIAYPKLESPIIIKISEFDKSLIEFKDQDYNLETGLMIGEESFYYGIIIIRKQDRKLVQEIYKTQQPIIAIGFENNKIQVYEDHKYLRWEFSPEGELLQIAKFSDLLRKEIFYIQETYHINSVEIEEFAELAVTYAQEEKPKTFGKRMS